MAATVAGALLSVSGVAAAQAAPSGSADTYDPQMLKTLAASLDISRADAADRLDRQADQQGALEKLRKDGVKVDSAFFDADAALVVNVGDKADAAEVRNAGLTARTPDHRAEKLERIKKALDERASEITPEGVTSWSVDVEAGKVEIRVADAGTKAAKGFLKAASKYEGAVNVVKGEKPVTFQQSVLPGSKMTYSGSGGYCSVGYGAKDDSGKDFLVTAGHCIGEGDQLLNNGGQFATAEDTRFAIGTDSVDMGIAALESGASISTDVDTYGNGSVSVQGGERALPGADLCKGGATTGWTCGKVQEYDVTVTYTDPSGGPDTVVTGLGRSTVCTEGGDSGGAYISGSQAQGMTSGGPMGQTCGGVDDTGSSYFQPLDDTLEHYGLTLNTV
ncbi:S1 family peptidase [Streptomyces sp. P38-E01]|uniref:S1 family peptidase n=1 Tax=Streptomyces tardus TaxID=2780544 RepID=A0A949JSD5_9ACTN|nr:S1 family peptidase [Streptomyces tardus]MBU7600361.1 S1 family peptidase [Streptomyces tardus]